MIRPKRDKILKTEHSQDRLINLHSTQLWLTVYQCLLVVCFVSANPGGSQIQKTFCHQDPMVASNLDSGSRLVNLDELDPGIPAR